MSDERLREAVRAARARGAVEDHAELLSERVRAGALPLLHMQVAAYLGHEAARRVGAAPLPEPEPDGSPSVSDAQRRLWDLFVRQRVPLAEALLREYACRCAERVLSLFEAARPGDPRPRRAIDLARAHARGPATGQDMLQASIDADEAADEAHHARAYAAACAGRAAACAAGAIVHEGLPPSDAQDARSEVEGPGAAADEAAWQARALIELLLAY